MNLYYAMGGGLGHLTRAVIFLRQFKIEEESIIISSSPFLGDNSITGNIKTVLVDEYYENDLPKYKNFLEDLIFKNNPKKIFIDAFPLGIIGEFFNFPFSEEIEVNYLARRLCWKKYLSSINEKISSFNCTYILEPLEVEHTIFIDKSSKNTINFGLDYCSLNSQSYDLDFTGVEPSYWLIVHSGPEAEVIELLDFAEEMRSLSRSDAQLVLISPTKTKWEKTSFLHLNYYPAFNFFERAEKIFSACGFNIMKQTENFFHKHYFIPFERRYDDQFFRAEIRKLKIKNAIL